MLNMRSAAIAVITSASLSLLAMSVAQAGQNGKETSAAGYLSRNSRSRIRKSITRLGRPSWLTVRSARRHFRAPICPPSFRRIITAPTAAKWPSSPVKS